MWGKEPVSAWTHLLAAAAALIGVIWLLTRTPDDLYSRIAILVYGIGLVTMFASSGFLHYIGASRHVRRWLNQADHIAIHLMIAGSFTAFSFFALNSGLRWLLITLVWLLTLVGIVQKVVAFRDNSPLSTAFYMLIGWLAVFAIPQLIANTSPDVIRLLIGGGLSFSVGALVYTFDDPKVRPLFGPHEAWHLFVIAGAAAHFAAIVALV